MKFKFYLKENNKYWVRDSDYAQIPPQTYWGSNLWRGYREAVRLMLVQLGVMK